MPALRPETFSRSFPKDHRAQTRKTETIKYSFFGTVKEEFFYGRDWSGCTLRRFAEELDGYLAWYVGGRLKAFGTPGGIVYDTIAHRREVLGYNS